MMIWPDRLRHRDVWTIRAVAIVLALALAVMLASATMATAQSGGLIGLPEDDGFAEVAPDEPYLYAEDRIDPARRGFETGAEDGFASWVTPLRLIDMRIRSRNGVARVTGERQVVDFDLYVTAAPEHRRMQIVTQSSIDLLPERSQMHLRVNGVDLGQAQLGNFDGLEPQGFDIPSNVLVNGRNRVQIEFMQRHRIFCGPEASFGLWTDIDLTRSGLVVAHQVSDVSADSFIMALAAQAAHPQPVEIRGLDRLDHDTAEKWRGDLVRRFNQTLLGEPVVFRFSDYWTVQDSQRAHARVTILPAAQSRVSYRVGGDGAQVMVLELAPDARSDDLLGEMQEFAPQPSAQRAPLVQPVRNVPFSEIGIRTESFSQRYAARNYPFRLPDDWLVLTAAKARINFDYVYATGLPHDAMLLLSVNGTAIRLLPLRDEGGQMITEFPIDFEARIMQPGTNTLSFELMVPGDPPDLPCPAVDRPFLQISETSTLHVPYSPKMAIPDMDLAFGALTPDSIRINDMSARAYSEADVLTLRAALARAQADIRPATLHLISIDDLGSIPAAHHRADRRLLEDVVLNLPDIPGTEDDMLLAFSDDPFAQRRQQGVGMVASMRAAVSNALGAVADSVKWVTDRVFPSSGDQLNNWLAERRGQAILFQLDPNRPDEIWMLRSPDSDIHIIAHSISAARAYGSGPRGQVSILGYDGRWDNWIAPDRRPILLEPWSWENFRYALGNFVSARPIFYTIMVLFLALSSALVALRLVISTREN